MSASTSDPAVPRRASCAVCGAVFRGGFRRCPQDGAPLSQDDVDPLVGTVLADRYQIEAVLGDGGLGRVYRARHVRMSRRYAIKVPFGEVGYDPKARARVANEAEAASRLEHPNVIGVIDVGETPAGLLYLAMDLAEGEPLTALIDDGPLPPRELLAIFAQLCEGLAHAHERGLVHRDLKPDNIMITRGDGGPHVRIIDFGLALLDPDGGATRLTTEGMVVGTPAYMAPEQATGETIDHRTDLFALGLILYEMLAGRLPFDGAPHDLARQNLMAELPPILERTGRLVDPLHEAVVGWLTRKAPGERPETTRAVLEVARALAAGDRSGAIMALPAERRPRPSSERSDPAARALSTAPTVVSPREPDGPGAIVSVADQPSLAPTTVAAARRRRGVGIAVAVLALLATAVAVIVRRDDGDRRQPAPGLEASAATVDAGARGGAGAVALDAAAVDPVAVAVLSIDAGVAPSAPPVEPAAAPRRRPPGAGPASAAPAVAVDAGPSAPPPATDRPTTDDTVGLSLRALYGRATTALDRAIAAHGDGPTADLRARLQRVPPYADATRKPALRTQAEAELRAIIRDLARLDR